MAKQSGKTGKKKTKKNVPHAVCSIQASFNNTIVTFTDPAGNALAWASAGGLGFRGSKKSTPFIKSELQNFYDHTDRILEGKGRGISLPEYGEISWDVEEASFLRISENLDTFYNELFDVIVCFLKEKNINFDREELKQALNYQKCRIPQPSARSEREVSFDQNFPLYFDTLLSDCPEPLAEHSQSILIKQKDFQNDKKLFAKEIILWGRKSGTNLTEVEFLPEASIV